MGRKNCENNSFELDEKELNCDKSRGQTTHKIEEERGVITVWGKNRFDLHATFCGYRAREMNPAFSPRGSDNTKWVNDTEH